MHWHLTWTTAEGFRMHRIVDDDTTTAVDETIRLFGVSVVEVGCDQQHDER